MGGAGSHFRTVHPLQAGFICEQKRAQYHAWHEQQIETLPFYLAWACYNFCSLYIYTCQKKYNRSQRSPANSCFTSQRQGKECFFVGTAEVFCLSTWIRNATSIYSLFCPICIWQLGKLIVKQKHKCARHRKNSRKNRQQQWRKAPQTFWRSSVKTKGRVARKYQVVLKWRVFHRQSWKRQKRGEKRLSTETHKGLCQGLWTTAYPASCNW